MSLPTCGVRLQPFCTRRAIAISVKCKSVRLYLCLADSAGLPTADIQAKHVLTSPSGYERKCVCYVRSIGQTRHDLRLAERVFDGHDAVVGAGRCVSRSSPGDCAW